MQGRSRMSIAQWLKSKKSFVPEEKRLSRDAVTSLTILTFFQLGASMSGVFLNLYLWRLTHSLWINGMYAFVTYLLFPLGFAAGGWLIKKKDRMISYRIGIFLTALFYLTVIMVGERLAEYYIVFAVCNGISQAFYWVGYLTLMYDVSNEHNRIRYLAMNTIFFTLASLIGPALAGFAIQKLEGLQGYTIVFGIAFAMFLLAALISLKIKALANHHKAYYLKFAGLLLRRDVKWLKALIGFFILALLQGIMLFLPSILLFRVMPREDIVGYLGVLYSSVSIFMSLIISKYAQADRVRLYLAASSIGFVLGSCILLYQVSLLTVILFMILYSIFAPLQGNSMNDNFFGLMTKLPLKGNLRVEGVVMREFFVNMGRVSAIFILILVAKDLESVWIPVILVAASVLQMLIVWMVNKQ